MFVESDTIELSGVSHEDSGRYVGLTFMAAAPARPVTDFETRQHKADENGELLYNLQVVWLEDDGRADHHGQGRG